jgi:release factor glutamine methyltransferase
MDLATMLQMNHSIDLLLFNPPYVVTSTEEIMQPSSKYLLHLAWAGGLKGREVTDRLLGTLDDTLSHKSLFYLVIIEENDPEEISKLLSLQGFQGQIIASRKVRNEKLHVMRFCRGM